MQGHPFNKTRVVLDDIEFTDCKITKCEAIAHTTEPGWKAVASLDFPPASPDETVH
jgi:hypothetical protein